jgi:hypothetical protein
MRLSAVTFISVSIKTIKQIQARAKVKGSTTINDPIGLLVVYNFKDAGGADMRFWHVCATQN